MDHDWAGLGGGHVIFTMRAKDAWTPEPAPWHTWTSNKPDPEGLLAPIRLSPMSEVQISSRKDVYTWQCRRCGSVVTTVLNNSPTPPEVYEAGVAFDCDHAVVDAVHDL